MADTLTAKETMASGQGIDDLRSYMTTTAHFVGGDSGLILLDATGIGKIPILGANYGPAAERIMAGVAQDMRDLMSNVKGAELFTRAGERQLQIDFTLPPLKDVFSFMGTELHTSFLNNIKKYWTPFGWAEGLIRSNINYVVYKNVPVRDEQSGSNKDTSPTQDALEKAFEPFLPVVQPLLNEPLLLVTGLLFAGGILLFLQGVGKKGSIAGGGVTVVSSNPGRRQYARL